MSTTTTVPFDKPEYPDPDWSPQDVATFLDKYFAYYYQSSESRPVEEFAPINAEELYSATLDDMIHYIKDEIVGKALYRDLSRCSKYAARYHVWPYYQVILLLGAICIVFLNPGQTATAWIIWFAMLLPCFPMYAIGAKPKQELSEYLVFRPWCVLNAQTLRVVIEPLWERMSGDE